MIYDRMSVFLTHKFWKQTLVNVLVKSARQPITLVGGANELLSQSCFFSPPPKKKNISEDGVVWLWHPLINLYIWLAISSCYSSIPLALVLIGRDVGLSTLCLSCGFACQQRVLKTFPSPGYLHSKDGVVWLWHPLVNFYIYIYI